MEKSRELLALLILLVTSGAKTVQAQPITPAHDGTGTVVSSPQNNSNQFDIKGGTQAGNNLFHSLQKLGLKEGQIANFLSNPNIHNILGRVVGGDASVIDGLLKVTGGQSNLYLINPAGIIFGSNAKLIVPGSFNATTANGIQIDDYWFKAMGSNNYGDLIGNPNGFAFTTDKPGSIINEGNLTVNQGETIRLVGGTVINTGTVSTPGGDITIAAVPGENLVRISPEGSTLSLDLPADTKTELNADSQLLDPLSLPQLLTGGDLNHASELVVENGIVKLRNSETIVPHDPGTTIASGEIDASNTVVGETGGTVNVLGDQVGVINGEIDVSGINGGGTALIGGDYKGQGTVPNAENTYISQDSAIAADALTDGNGGRVIAWADNVTGFYGDISARGGAESGDGGFVEVSGKQDLIFRGDVDVSAVNGSPGRLLLDPENIIILAGDQDTTNDDQTDDSQILFGESPDATFTISQGALEGLDGDTDVILEATNDISIESLTDDELTFSSGSGSIRFTADADNDGAGSFLMFNQEKIQQLGDENSGIGNIVTQGRNLTIQGASIIAGGINTSFGDSNGDDGGDGGNVRLTATSGDVVVRFVDASDGGSDGNRGGDITISAAQLFRATGVRNGSTESILTSGFLDGSLNEAAQGVLGGEIKITAQSTSGKLEIGARQTDDQVINSGNELLVELIPIGDEPTQFNLSEGESGTRGAIVTRNFNGQLSSVVVDTGQVSADGSIALTLLPPEIGNDATEQTEESGEECDPSDAECKPSDEEEDKILNVSNVPSSEQSE